MTPVKNTKLGKGLEALIETSETPDLQKQIDELTDKQKKLERELDEHRVRTEGLSAQEMFKRAKAFKDNNPGIWDQIVADARIAAKYQRRFSVKKEIEELRETKWILLDEHEDYRFNNSYTAPLTRFLIQEVPEVEPYVHIRTSKTDKYFED